MSLSDYTIAIGFALVAFGTALEAPAAALDRAGIDSFIAEMSARHAFDPAELEQSFTQAKRLDSVLKAISRPAEGKPWHRYRPIFLTRERIAGGATFWQENEQALNDAYERYGVPPEIVVAIIGVETFYGRNAGSYRVLDSLATLAFHYPKRAEFFRSELEQFLLLAREEGVEPLSLTGSYAGAMGMPQFISSSFRRYAVDFDGNGRRDIWNARRDVVGSVANYLHEHGWQRDESVISRVLAPGADVFGLVSESLEKPTRPLSDFISSGVLPVDSQRPDSAAMLLRLEGADAPEYWFGFDNFYVITRYNHSVKYAMAVAQLAGAVRDRRQSSTL